MDMFIVDRLSNAVDVSKQLLRKKIETLSKYGDKKKEELINELCNINIEKLCDNSTSNSSNNSVVLFCVIRNEYGRIHHFINYYKKIGVKSFVFLDNNSDDGTKRYLLKQEGVVLYSTTDEYSSLRRVAWLNYLLLMHGNKKWCLVVDSDEYITYLNFESCSLERIITTANRKSIKRVEGFLLDMYPKGKMFCGGESCAFLKDNIFYDYTGYEVNMWKHGTYIKGGPRKRVFNCDVLLSKYPLFLFDDEVFYANSHYLLPDNLGSEVPIWFAIRHYKFLDKKDLNKVKTAVESENYFRSSEEYKKYMANIQINGFPVFFSEYYSTEFVTSSSLRQILFLQDPFS